MNVLLSAISISEKSHFELLHNLALIRLSHLHLLLHQPLKAIILAQQVLPYLLSNSSSSDQGLAQYIMTLCIISQPAPDCLESLHCIDNAIAVYESVSSMKALITCYTLKAVICHRLNDSESRNNFSLRAKLTKEMYMKRGKNPLPYCEFHEYIKKE